MNKALAEIENRENLRLHRQGWAAQKVFRVVLLLFVAAAAAGVFGSGPVSQREVRFGDDLVVRSERMARVESATRLEIRCLTGSPDGRLPVVMANGMVDRYEIEKVWPEPLSQASTGQGIRYEFLRQPGSQVVISLIPKKAGKTDGSVMIGPNAVDFSQVIYP